MGINVPANVRTFWFINPDGASPGNPVTLELMAYLVSLFLISFSVLPTIRARQSDVNATADIGSTALLACDADGFPDPIVTWTQYVIRCCYWLTLIRGIPCGIRNRSELSE